MANCGYFLLYIKRRKRQHEPKSAGQPNQLSSRRGCWTSGWRKQFSKKFLSARVTDPPVYSAPCGPSYAASFFSLGELCGCAAHVLHHPQCTCARVYYYQRLLSNLCIQALISLACSNIHSRRHHKNTSTNITATQPVWQGVRCLSAGKERWLGSTPNVLSIHNVSPFQNNTVILFGWTSFWEWRRGVLSGQVFRVDPSIFSLPALCLSTLQYTNTLYRYFIGFFLV